MIALPVMTVQLRDCIQKLLEKSVALPAPFSTTSSAAPVVMMTVPAAIRLEAPAVLLLVSSAHFTRELFA